MMRSACRLGSTAIGLVIVCASACAPAAAGEKPRVQIMPYVGYGDGTRFVAIGRVLKARALRPPTTHWDRLVNNVRRMRTSEIADMPIVARVGRVTAEGRTNAEGYYHVVLRLPSPTAVSDGLVEGEVSMGFGAERRAPAVKAQFVTPTATSRFGVISDVDDTILVSHVTRKVKMLWEAAFGDARTRSVLPGTPALYHALREGVAGRECNPLFYVSANSWNLYEVFRDSFQRLGLPRGHFALRDIGLGKDADPLFDIKAFKRGRIRELLAFYPEMKFVLIGDSGQEDPELYAELATDARYRDRVLAVYVRFVHHATDRKRQRELAELRLRVGRHFHVFCNAFDAAAHAAKHGLISEDSLGAIHASLAPSGSLRPGAGTRYPIVLVHGLLGFSKIGVEGFGALTYFHGIPRHLGKHGYRVWVTEVGKTDGVEARARQLKTSIDQLTAGKVNIVAHSMGGLDARHMITHLGMADRVASLVTIGTPHRGTSFADWGTTHLGGTVPLLDALGVHTAAFFDLTSQACEAFNRKTPDAPGVRYFSYSGTQARARIFPPLQVSYDIIQEREGPNDGLVSRRSAQWGQYLGDLDADHLNLVGWKFAWERGETFDAKKFYLGIAQMLKDKGF